MEPEVKLQDCRYLCIFRPAIAEIGFFMILLEKKGVLQYSKRENSMFESPLRIIFQTGFARSFSADEKRIGFF